MISSIERIQGDIPRQGLTFSSNFQKIEPNVVHTFQTNSYLHRLKIITWASILTLYLVQHICQGENLSSKNVLMFKMNVNGIHNFIIQIILQK